MEPGPGKVDSLGSHKSGPRPKGGTRVVYIRDNGHVVCPDGHMTALNVRQEEKHSKTVPQLSTRHLL